MKKIGLLPRLLIAIVLGVVVGMICLQFKQPGGAAEIVVRIAATFNGLFGNFLNFAIPLIIIGFVVPGIAELGTGAGKTLAITAGIAYGSTICAGMLAYLTASAVFPLFLHEGMLNSVLANPEEALLPSLITIEMPPIMGVMTALLIAFVMGLGISICKAESMKGIFNELQDIITKLISSIVIPLLPFHVFGIFCNMTYGGMVFQIMSVFIRVFGIIILLHIIILVLQYTFACSIGKKNPIACLKNMLPAYMTAIGTQSSAATIPVTLAATKSNKVSDSVADFVIPLCATIHLSGSTITLTSCSIAIMMLFGKAPSFSTILPFILMLGVTMVAAPGVPGGAVMAALGIIQSMLGFNETESALIIALYLAQDSFGTACNVTGDGSIAILVDAITGKKKTVGARA